ncbi:MAG: hypothetical protein JWO67_6113 [Streptosporangiaceae bacterium]|nr:hypothetical protein [Streptosporangiaceae bacterium]
MELYDNPDGTADLSGRDLPADEAEAAFNYVSALAAAIKADGDERPLAAIRADVLLRLLRGRGPAEVGSAGGSAGIERPAGAGAGLCGDGAREVGDTGASEAAAVAEAVWDELDELLAHSSVSGGPAERRLLVAEAARRMREAFAELKIRWCEVGVDQDGDPVHGRDGYRPSAGMRRLVQARNRMCVFPTCRRPAAACDLDHTIPYHRGGPTCPCNLAPLCRRHHRLKQAPDWTLIQPWPGVALWITPTGHWHLVGPGP